MKKFKYILTLTFVLSCILRVDALVIDTNRMLVNWQEMGTLGRPITGAVLGTEVMQPEVHQAPVLGVVSTTDDSLASTQLVLRQEYKRQTPLGSIEYVSDTLQTETNAQTLKTLQRYFSWSGDLTPNFSLGFNFFKLNQEVVGGARVNSTSSWAFLFNWRF